MRKYLLLFVVAFFIGFLSHAFFFPDLLPNQLVGLGKKSIGLTEQSGSIAPNSPPELSYVNVSYKNKRFSPSNIVSRVGNRLILTNNSEDLLWLQSEHQLFNTERGFGTSEAFDVKFDEPGSFTVINKLEPTHTLIITVKK